MVCASHVFEMSAVSPPANAMKTDLKEVGNQDERR